MLLKTDTTVKKLLFHEARVHFSFYFSKGKTILVY